MSSDPDCSLKCLNLQGESKFILQPFYRINIIKNSE